MRRRGRRAECRRVGGHEIGHGEDLARLHVHDDGGAADGVGGLDGLGQRLLRLVLELRVERQLQPGARASRPPGSSPGTAGSATPAGDCMIVSLPSTPASRWLSPYSSPAAPLPGGVGEPDHGRGEVPVRHLPLGVVDRARCRGRRPPEIFCPVAWGAGGPGRRSPSAGAARRPASRRERGGWARARWPSSPDARSGSRRPRRRRWGRRVPAARRRGRRCRRATRRADTEMEDSPARRRLVGARVQDLDVDQPGHHEQHGQQEDEADEPHPAREGPALPARAADARAGGGRPWPVGGAGAAGAASPVPPPRRRAAWRGGWAARPAGPAAPGEPSGYRWSVRRVPSVARERPSTRFGAL